jgi:T-complex protein 1 subunit delta
VISESFQRAAVKAGEILEAMSKPVDLNDEQLLIKIASTSLNSKVVSQQSWLLAPMAVKAIRSVVNIDTDTNVDLKAIKIVKKLG